MENTKLTRGIDIQEGATITVEIENSPLSIRPSESGDLMMSVEINLSNPDQIEKIKNIEDKQELLNEIFDVSGQKTSHVHIEIDDEAMDEYIQRGWNRNFLFTLEIPKNSPLIAENENGSLDVEGLMQTMTLRTENGPIRVKSSQGMLQVEAENGPVDIAEVAGNIIVHMENGPLKIINSTGDTLTVEAENGPLSIKENIFNSVKVRGENGPIKVDVPKEASGVYSVESENGQIHIQIAEGSQYEIKAETEYGPINLRLAESAQVIQKEYEDDFKKIHVKEGEGGAKINLRTETAMIKVSETNAGEKEFRFEFHGGPDNIGVDVGNIASLASTLAGQISQTVASALGKVVKKINVPEMERKMEMERFAEKMQKVQEKIQRAVDPDFDIPEPPEPPEFEEKQGKLKVLELLEKGKITADEAAMLLGALKSKE